MNHITLPLLMLSLSLGCVSPSRAAEPNAVQAKASAEIKEVGGTVTVDEKSPDKPVIGVTLLGFQVTDADLACRAGLASLQSLDFSDTNGRSGSAFAMQWPWPTERAFNPLPSR
jgi:hypothetical protein